MSEGPPLLFAKRLGMLAPANRAAEEALSVIDGTVRVRITRTRGNSRRNGLYWAVLGVAAPMLEERAPGLTVELLHRVLKDRAGLVKLVTLPSGETVKDYESISFAKMAEPERAKFIDWSLRVLSDWLGCNVTELRNEAEREAA